MTLCSVIVYYMFKATVSLAVIVVLLYIQDNMEKKLKQFIYINMILDLFFHLNNLESKIKTGDLNFHLL